MTVSDSDFPSSKAFDLIEAALKNEKERNEAISKGKAIFAFTLKNTAGKTESWYLDLKNTGTVGKGLAPEGEKSDVTLVLNDETFEKLVNGNAKAQQLFMSGKLKIKGNMMKATRLEPILSAAKPPGAKL